MPWVITFIASWILFLILVDWRELKTNVWGGVLALMLATLVDWGGQKLELYTFNSLIIPWFGCSAFYKLGPVFTMGILFCQAVPKSKWLQIIHVLAFSVIFLAVERLIIGIGVAEYLHWHSLASLFINLLALTGLTWFKLEFLQSKGEKNQ